MKTFLRLLIIALIIAACKKDKKNPTPETQGFSQNSPAGYKKIKTERSFFSNGTSTYITVTSYYYDSTGRPSRTLIIDSVLSGNWTVSYETKTYVYNANNKWSKFYDTINNHLNQMITWFYDNNGLLSKEYTLGEPDTTLFIHNGNKMYTQLKPLPLQGSPVMYYTDGDQDSIVNYSLGQPMTRYVFTYSGQTDLRYKYRSVYHPYQPAYKLLQSQKNYDGQGGSLTSTYLYVYEYSWDFYPIKVTIDYGGGYVKTTSVSYY